jgi:hypothetical protein
MVALMDAAGYDLVVVETVGTGQSEVAVAGLTDSLLVVFPPGLGDEIQANKAGILELADVLVVTKGDTAGAGIASQALQAATPLWRKAPPIHAVSALTGDGVGALADAVLARAHALRQSGRRAKINTERVHPSLAEDFGKLWLELGRRLPSGLAGGLSMRLPGLEAASQESGLQVLVSVRPGGDSFQLGAAAGALAILADAMNLTCIVKDLDVDSDRMVLQLDRAAGPG